MLDSEGRSDFHLLQDYRRTGSGDLAYYIFDLLYWKATICAACLYLEEEHPETIIPALPVSVTAIIFMKTERHFRLAKQNRLEGIMAKEA